MPSYEFLVLTSAIEGGDDLFNTWYDDIHLDDVLQIPGVVSAKRFRISHPRTTTTALPDWKYAAIYSLDCDDPQSVLDEIKIRTHTPAMKLTEALDISMISTFILNPLNSQT